MRITKYDPNAAMRAYLEQTAKADRERNKAILQQCRENLIKHKIFTDEKERLTANT